MLTCCLLWRSCVASETNDRCRSKQRNVGAFFPPQKPEGKKKKASSFTWCLEFCRVRELQNARRSAAQSRRRSLALAHTEGRRAFGDDKLQLTRVYRRHVARPARGPKHQRTAAVYARLFTQWEVFWAQRRRSWSQTCFVAARLRSCSLCKSNSAQLPLRSNWLVFDAEMCAGNGEHESSGSPHTNTLSSSLSISQHHGIVMRTLLSVFFFLLFFFF